MTCRIALLMATLLFLPSCTHHQQATPDQISAIAGAWKCRLIEPRDEPFSLITQFSMRPDSSLSRSLTYEIAPRSRVWSDETDVIINDRIVRWAEHEGILNDTQDTIHVTWSEPYGKTKWIYVRDRSVDSLMTRLSSRSNQLYRYLPPKPLDDGWPCENIESLNADNSRIIRLVQDILDGEHDDIHSLLIAKDGRLVLEEYFASNGSAHGPFITEMFRDKVHHLASTTKSVTSLLVGIAIDHQHITSVEDPIHRYLPAYSSLFTEAKKTIRICDLLTMTPGFELRQFGVSDDQNDGMQMWSEADVIRFVLAKPLVATPGSRFNYSNGAPTVTGAIIKNAVEKDVRKFAEDVLFRPLGISKYVWTNYPDGSIETDGGLALR